MQIVQGTPEYAGRPLYVSESQAGGTQYMYTPCIFYI